MSASAANQFTDGVCQALGSDLTNKVIQTPQAQQALQYTANGIAQSGAAVVAATVAVTHATTAAVAVLALPVAAGVAAAAVVGYGSYWLWEWLES